MPLNQVTQNPIEKIAGTNALVMPTRPTQGQLGSFIDELLLDRAQAGIAANRLSELVRLGLDLYPALGMRRTASKIATLPGTVPVWVSLGGL
jgi:hypothetical protein